MTRIYKILRREEWDRARALRRFEGSAVDLADGYIHFSTAAQAQETARRHFAGQDGLVVLELDTDDLGPDVKWEPSRGGDLFAHLYGSFEAAQVLAVHEAPLGDDGVPMLGDLP